jgi:hypothetical protein
MKDINITKSNKKMYVEAFVSWMQEKYPNIKRTDIIGSNIMYTINRDCGFSINDLINGRITLDAYRDKYEQYFEIINRKSPSGHANVQKWNAQYFIEFIHDCFLNENRI